MARDSWDGSNGSPLKIRRLQRPRSFIVASSELGELRLLKFLDLYHIRVRTSTSRGLRVWKVPVQYTVATRYPIRHTIYGTVRYLKRRIRRAWMTERVRLYSTYILGPNACATHSLSLVFE